MKRLGRANLAVVLAAIFFWTLAGAFLWLRIATPSDGARMASGDATVWQPNGIIISPIEEQTEGLRKGDLVIAVDGHALASWAESLFDLSAPRPCKAWRVGQTVTYTVVRDGQRMDVPVPLTTYPLGSVVAQEWGAIVFAISYLFVVAFVFFKRPDEPAARVLFLGAAGMLGATTWSFGLQVSDLVNGMGFWLYKVTSQGAFMLVWIGALHLALIFPQRRPMISRYRFILPTLYVIPYLVLVVYDVVAWISAASALDWLSRAGGAVGKIELVYLLLAIVVGLRGYRAARDPVSRQQVRWFALAMLTAGIVAVIFGMLPGTLLGYPLLSWNVIALFGLLIPLALGFAIMRYHLFDIDVIINRTLVYGALTVCTMALYAFVVGYVGNLFQASERSVIAFLTTGLVAVLFQPLRERVQRAVNRLMYGERDDPYAVLSRLGQRLEVTLAPDAVLPTIVETVAQTLKLPCVAIALREADEFKIVAAYPPSSTPVSAKQERKAKGKETEGEVLPLVYQGETIGQLIFAPRAPGEPFTPTERHLLEDITHQAGVAAHAVRLTADLQRSRERLVTTREEERRRLRRDLHDELGPTLASQALKLDAALEMLGNDQTQVGALLVDLKSQTQGIVANIRRLVYELRPPALDELGLVSALRAHAGQYSGSANGPHISIEAPLDGLPPLSAAVEVAAYRIALEAITNVVRHAHARECVVRVSVANGSALQLEIRDDGIGLPRDRHTGVGLNSMRERAEELGGTLVVESLPTNGTRVVARLPLINRT